MYLCLIQVTDADFGTNAAVDFSLNSSADGLFGLIRSGPLSTSLFLTHFLDRETTASYSFAISVMDRGTPSLTGRTVVTVNVVVSTRPHFVTLVL